MKKKSSKENENFPKIEKCLTNKKQLPAKKIIKKFKKVKKK